MASVHSDAGDMLSRASNVTAYEDHIGMVSADIHSNVQHLRTDHSRGFIMERFLPAAQAMAAARGESSSTSTISSSLPAPDKMPHRNSSARFVSSKTSKSQYIDEVKQDVRREDFANDGDELTKACGFPLHFGRLTLQHFRLSFWTSRSVRGRKSKSRSQTPTKPNLQENVATQAEASDNSEEMFWSEEEGFDNAVTAGCDAQGTANDRDEKKRLAQEMLRDEVFPIRMHSMETVHTPNHRGFLGLPKTATKFEIEEAERTGQVDRLGARLTQMMSKTNYMEPRVGASRMNEHEETDLGREFSSSQGHSATTSSSSVEAPPAQTKWLDAVSKLLPPPSPKMPSQSWLSSALPPERYLEVKKLSRKSLGSFIPIKPPPKPSSSTGKHPYSCEVH